MSEVQPQTMELKARYTAQVIADLEHNVKEQERIDAEVASLQEQSRALQHDRALLMNLQRTLAGESATAAGPGEESKEPAPASMPRQAAAGHKPARQKKTAAAAPKGTAAKGTGTRASTTAAKPTLVELIRDHLARQSEPLSAAEITTALAQAHPDRTIKPTVVRTTIEGLVAKGRTQRTKQGTSVFYTATSR